MLFVVCYCLLYVSDCLLLQCVVVLALYTDVAVCRLRLGCRLLLLVVVFVACCSLFVVLCCRLFCLLLFCFSLFFVVAACVLCVVGS